uniref:Putative capsid morphogenesis protein n=1 Tax=viral metagenome TaxID=1070528 RepID=A0A6M3L621_9ZZZZ
MTEDFLDDVFTMFAEYVSLEELRVLMEETMYEAVRAALSGATREEVMQAARDKAALLVTRVSEEMRQQLAEKIAYGIENQLGVDGTGRLLREALGLDSNREKSLAKFRLKQEAAGKTGDALEKAVAREQARLLNDRARVIAINEIGEALESGALETGIKQGNTHKVSISVGDARVSEICRQSEGQGPIPINDAFASGSQHPPHHIRCRCAVAFVRDTGKGQLEQAQERAAARAARTKQAVDEANAAAAAESETAA